MSCNGTNAPRSQIGGSITPEDLELIREIVLHGGAKYTAGKIDRSKYQRLVDLGWLSSPRPNRTSRFWRGISASRSPV
jgi:hypothetical protein